MSKPLTVIRDEVRVVLLDAPGPSNHFEDEDLDIHIQRFLETISIRVPYEKKETLSTTANSRDLDVSGITGLIDVDYVEYLVDQDTKQFRNVTRFSDVITMAVNALPSGSQSVYAYCLKLHELKNTSSTLPPYLEGILVDGSAALAVMSWVQKGRVQLEAVITLMDTLNTAVDSVSAQLTQSTALLDAGSAFIASEAGSIGTAIDTMQSKILAAGTLIASGTALINTVTIGGDPIGDYARYSQNELAQANEYMAMARGYLLEGGQAGQYRAQAGARLQAAGGYLGQATGYAREAHARMQLNSVMKTYEAWGRDKLAMARQELRGVVTPRVARDFPRS